MCTLVTQEEPAPIVPPPTPPQESEPITAVQDGLLDFDLPFINANFPMPTEDNVSGLVAQSCGRSCTRVLSCLLCVRRS